MRIQMRRDASAVIISPCGRMDAAGGSALEAEFATLAMDGGRVVLDCRRIDYISSAGLRAVLLLAKACLREKSEFLIAALRPECRSVVETSGLLSVLKYRETVEAALQADGPSRPHEEVTATDIRERHEGRATVVSLNGRLSGDGASVLTAKVSDIIERGVADVVLDCGNLIYVNSAGLRALLICAKACQQGGGQLTLAALTPECRSVLAMSGFLSIIAHRTTVDAALADYGVG